MTTAITVPAKEFRNFFGSKAIPTQAKAYGYDFPTYIRNEFAHGPFNSIPVVALYEKQPQHFLDKLLNRTRYTLISVRVPGWGTLARNQEAKGISDADVYKSDLSHLLIKHNWYVDIPKLYKKGAK